MRHVYSYAPEGCPRHAVVAYDFDYEEFRILCFTDGVRHLDLDYFTPDKSDAVGMARGWVMGCVELS
jgi:hypothetical protein